jgi:hypothetical protein
MPEAQRLMTIPGVGVLTATALVAFVGDARRFRSGRAFAAYLGLTPKEFSSGSIRRLGSITKHGNTYLRMMLTHGGPCSGPQGAVASLTTSASGPSGCRRVVVTTSRPWHSQTVSLASPGACGATTGQTGAGALR